jgi:hypothetical protein
MAIVARLTKIMQDNPTLPVDQAWAQAMAGYSDSMLVNAPQL